MKVFITGAAGFIGKAVIEDLQAHGHQAIGLARSDSSAETVSKLGAEVVRGDLDNLESLKQGAKAADGVIHLAFVHDFSDFAAACAKDRAAIEAMAEAMAGTGKPLAIASGTLMLPKGTLGTEDTEPERNNPPFSDRCRSQDLLESLTKEKSIRGITVRLSPTVHDAGDYGMIPGAVGAAQKFGSLRYIADGTARWPAVHRRDAAALFRLAIEKGKAGGIYHAVGEQEVPLMEIFKAASKKTGMPLELTTPDKVNEALGFYGHVVVLDNPTSSEKTQKELGWTPNGLGLLADIEANYF